MTYAWYIVVDRRGSTPSRFGSYQDPAGASGASCASGSSGSSGAIIKEQRYSW